MKEDGSEKRNRVRKGRMSVKGLIFGSLLAFGFFCRSGRMSNWGDGIITDQLGLHADSADWV